MSQLRCSEFLWFCPSYRVAIECCSAVAALHLQAEVVGDLHIRVLPSTKMFRPAANTFLRSAARMASQVHLDFCSVDLFVLIVLKFNVPTSKA